MTVPKGAYTPPVPTWPRRSSRAVMRFTRRQFVELGHLGLRAYLAANPALAREALVWMHYGANIGASTGEVGMACSADHLESASLRALATYDLTPAGYGPDGV